MLTTFSLCPTNASIPIEATGIIPVSASDVVNIPSIALVIPDFEGQAILRIFSNETETEIGCYSAVVTNGATFSHPSAVGSVLGVFTFIALVSSFATAVYGDHISTTRIHYAHSLSVFVVFSVLQHIFYTGALSMNWPSVLPAFWSNFAWSAGMIHTQKMQMSIDNFLGSNKGNTSVVGAAGSGSSSDGVGGGYQISQIYKRGINNLLGRDISSSLGSSSIQASITKRSLQNSSDGYTWYGLPADPNLPLPGNYSGFAGTLSDVDIAASNAFMTGFLWLLILTVSIAASVILLKWALEALSKFKMIKPDRLSFFRTHYLGFTAAAVLRTVFIAFFMMMFLTLFQFSYRGSAGVTAIAAMVFIIFFVGLFGVTVYACRYRLRYGRYSSSPDRLHLEKGKIFGAIPWYEFTRESQRSEKSTPKASVGSLPWWRISHISDDPQQVEVHQDDNFNKKFGWLSARFRRTRWWFFTVWLVYEFIRACFYGGAAGRPLTQVFGLLVVEIIAFVAIILMKPFEGARLNALMVYILGFSKVATVALSAAFDARFNLPRILATVIGIVIIVIQGFLTISLMILIALGAISSFMSVTRNREDFYPRSWAPLRQKYLAHITSAALDQPPPPPPLPEEPKEPYFNVGSVRRLPKIEDEDNDPTSEQEDFYGSRTEIAGPVEGSPVNTRHGRANSMRSTKSNNNLPFGARPHRTSWSNQDFANWHESNRNSAVPSRNGMQSVKSMRSDQSLRSAYQQRSRAPSRGATIEVAKSRNGKEKEQVPLIEEMPKQDDKITEVPAEESAE